MLALLMPLTMFSLFDMILTLIVTHVIQLMNQVKKIGEIMILGPY